MSDPAPVCPQCGAELPAGLPSALCAACLLKLGFESHVPLSGPATGPYQPHFLMPNPEELGPRFPQLEILERIGCGGMGVVYRARQKDLDRIVALKILRPDHRPDAAFAERFQREARALARLNHPHIVTVHEFGRTDDLFYFIMEFVDGINLRQLEKASKLTPVQALAIVPQVCSALQYAHEQGVVHRDIKPENILVAGDGRVKIADFGLAKLAGHPEQTHLTGMWQVMGTPHYMAPEQVEHPTDVDHRADIYSLGVVIYEMLTGELPLGRFPVPSRKVQIDVRLDDVVLRALEKEPESRYQHVTDVQSDIEQIRQSPGKKSASPKATFASRFASMTTHNRYQGEPESVRAEVLSDLKMPADALVILGLIEILAALPVLVFLPSLAFLTLPLGVLAVWTGLNLKHAENSTASLVGCLLSLVPSLLWLFKLPFNAMALSVLCQPRAREAFKSVPLAECHAWTIVRGYADPVVDWSRQTVRSAWSAFNSQLPSRETTNAAGAAVGGTVAQIPRHVATAGQSALSVLQHPITRGILSWLFWSFLWSAYCAGVVVALVPFSEPDPVGLVLFLCWALGVVVLGRNSLMVCTARLNGQTPSRAGGPQSALLATVAVSGLVGLLLLAFAAFDRNHQFYPWSRIPSADWGLVHLVFGLICGMAAVLLNWTLTRWLTRALLGVALVLPPVMVIAHPMSTNEFARQLLALLPLILALPAILWGFWGSRTVYVRKAAPQVAAE